MGQEPVDAAVQRGMALLPASILAVPTTEAEEALTVLAELRRSLCATSAWSYRSVPPPEPDLREQARRSGGARRRVGRVRVQAAWAPETSRVLYGESPVATTDPPDASHGFLTYPDLELLSVRDPGHLTKRGEGESGELVITSLGWRGTVLIRAATGSWVAGMHTESVHPVSGATVPRIAPAAVDGAWQPTVSTADGPRRVDLRGAARVVRRAREAWAADGVVLHDWSLRVVGEELTLAVDLGGAEASLVGPSSTDRLARLQRDLGDTVGVPPAVRRDAALAAARPQVGTAGASS